jgi:hypothetical protein
MTLRTMADVRRELRRLLDDLMAEGRVKQSDIIAAFRTLPLTDKLREEVFDVGLAEILRLVVERDTFAARRRRELRRQRTAQPEPTPVNPR